MTDNIAETFLSEDENIRAQVVLDEHSYDMKPDGDCYGTVLYQQTGYGSHVDLWCERYKSTDDFESVFADLWERRRDLDEIEAIMRGKLNICEHCYRLLKYVESEDEWIAEGALVDSDLYCIGADDEETFCEPEYTFSDNWVVGFAVTELRDGRLINIVGLEDLKVWGWDSPEAFDAAFPGVDPSENNLSDFEAYANGDVYYVLVEEKVKVTSQIRAMNRDELIREVESDEWENLDYTCHGFYGVEAGVEYAKESLKHAVETAEARAA